MNAFRKSLSTMLIGALAVGGYMGVNSLVRNSQFVQAQEQVQASREQLKNVDDLATVYRAVGKAVEPSVVKIDVTKTIKGVRRTMPFDDDALRRFFPDLNDQDGDGKPAPQPRRGRVNPPNDSGGDELEQNAEGSGVIMEAADGAGYILTNNHVAGGADKMEITLWDGRKLKGKVLGTDPKSDLAVVKVDAEKLIPARWGDSDKLEKGDIIFAFGSPFGYVGSMTHGIVSALNRQNIGILRNTFSYENFIQVDAPINPGNSGGPLVNLHGEVVGINTAIATETGVFNGIGFAIPANQAKGVYAQLKNTGKMVRGYLGVGIQDMTDPVLARTFGYEGTGGVLLGETQPDGPARGKLKKGDIVTAIDGKKIADTNQLRTIVAGTEPGKELTLTVFRDGKSQDVAVKIGEQPEKLVTARRPGKSQSEDNENSADETSADAVAKTLGLHVATVNDDLITRFQLDDGTKGAVVTGVDRKSAAARAGLMIGDVITQVGKQDVASAKQATDILAKQDLSKGIRLSVTSAVGSRFVLLKEEN